MDKLKPCPFCGCKDVMIIHPPHRGACIICECCFLTVSGIPEDLLVDAWNRRANEYFSISKEDDSERGTCL